MCDAGQPTWIFTDAEACGVSSAGRLVRCACPLARCTLTAGGYACQLTPVFLTVAGLLVIISVIAMAVYLYASNLVNDYVLIPRNDIPTSLDKNFRAVLFPEDREAKAVEGYGSTEMSEKASDKAE